MVTEPEAWHVNVYGDPWVMVAVQVATSPPITGASHVVVYESGVGETDEEVELAT